MIAYFIQFIVFQALFLGVYELFLKKETFFSLNRAYLLATPFLAGILPFLEFQLFQSFVPVEGIVQLPALVVSESLSSTTAVPSEVEGPFALLNFLKTNALIILYFLGIVISSALFLRKYFQLKKLKQSATTEKMGEIMLVKIPGSRIACTFFNTIFLGNALSEEEKKRILEHELVHVRQRHSADLLLFEILRILLWFNPFIYRQQTQLSLLHEYIADEKASTNSEKPVYFQGLLNTAFQTRQFSFANQFFKKSLIKKRIAMLQKQKSNRNAKLKYLLVLPLVLGMLTYVACSNDKDFTEAETIKGVKTLKMENWKAMTEKQEADITEEILKIGTEYDKVIVKDIENELTLVFLNNNWEEGFTEKTNEGTFRVLADKIIGNSTEERENYNKSFPPPPPPSPFEGNEIPFAAVDKIPVFPSCENLSMEKAKSCMSKKIAEFVNANFDTGLVKKLELTGSQRIQVLFKISQTGEVVDATARAPHPGLEKEAVRVVNMLPKMVPGQQNGKTVSVLYSLPIIFQVQ